MTILLTGGAGFIGSHLTAHLLGLGHAVICLDNFDTYYKPQLKRRNIEPFLAHRHYVCCEGDVRNRPLVAQLLREHTCDTVIHLAARAGVRPSVSDPALYVDVNVHGTLALLEAMRDAGVPKLVMASSSSVYGDATPDHRAVQSPALTESNVVKPLNGANKRHNVVDTAPVDTAPVDTATVETATVETAAVDTDSATTSAFRETDSCDRPLSPYAASKRAAELLAHTYHHLYGLDVVCLRFFTVYGPRQRPEMAISQFTDAMLRGRPITLFGDGASARDYTFVDDTVAGILAALAHPGGFDVVNIGGSEPVTLRHVVGLIEQAVGREALIRYAPMQPGDVARTCADLTHARARLGYVPRVRIDEGIRRFVAWYQTDSLNQAGN